MHFEPIHGYCLDLRQDFPEDLRIAQQECKLLRHTNKVLTTTLTIVGIGLLAVFVFQQIGQKPAKEDLQK